MRHALVILLGLGVAASVAAAGLATTPVPAPVAPAAPLSAPVYVVTGSGYGHGVGLSQYGAFAQAKAGRSYRDILSFYFPGTEIARAPIAKVRVLIADARPSVRIGSMAPFTVTGADGAVTPLPAGELTLGPDLAPVVAGARTALEGPLVFRPGKGAVLTLDGKGYRGELRVTVVLKRLRVIDVVALDSYILGVVPGEVPKEWPAAALQAQAVAARSYALASLVKNRDFDLYADVRSQMYYGTASESPPTTAAVQATKGQILTFAGKVATTFYYSSSGGRTAAAVDVFGLDIPYLQARDDPWDTLSPYRVWTPRSFTASALGKALGLSAPVVDVQAVPTPSGRPASVTVVKQTGQSVLLKASDIRARLGLRSTAFRIGVLRVARPPVPTAPGSPVVVSGLARDVEAPLLEKLGQNGAWLPSVKVAPDPDGVFAVTVRPQATATYRLTAHGQPGPALTITVPAGQPR